jgi:nitrogen regulatory protein PII
MKGIIMKMLMIICPKARQDEITKLIENQGVHAFSEIPEIIGEGETGKKMGTHVFPEKSSLIFTVIPENKEQELVVALRHSATHLYPGEGMKAFVLPVETVV